MKLILLCAILCLYTKVFFLYNKNRGVVMAKKNISKADLKHAKKIEKEAILNEKRKKRLERN